MNNPKISIVTVCYNAVDTIEATLVSVINQTYANIEYIVIDGGSKDGTCDIVKRHLDKISFFISEPDHGIYDAMNKGVLKATGDYINFMNAGDSFYSDTVLSQVVPFLEKKTVVVYGKIMRILKDCRFVGKIEHLEELANKDVIPHQAAFIRLDYQKNNLFDTSFKSSGDYKFFYDAFFRDHCSFQFINMIVANFDSEDNGMSRSNIFIGYKEDLKIKGIPYDSNRENEINKQVNRQKIKRLIISVLPKPFFYVWRRYQLKKHGYEIII